MKKIFAVLCIPTALLVMAACGSSEKKGTETLPADSVAAADEAAPSETLDVADAATEQEQMAMLEQLLKVNGGEDEQMLRQCCTPKAIQQLRDDYEYDVVDGDPLAIWAIDGRNAVDAAVELASLRKVGPDRYQATFNMTVGSDVQTSVMEYTLAEENGSWKIDSYRQVSGN